jgi:RNA polymerase sigma-70 factor (ECF subfamily)
MEPNTRERHGSRRATRADDDLLVGRLSPRFDSEHANGAGQQATESFENLIHEHLGSLFDAALRLTHNWTDAEDLLQDTIERAYRAFDRYRAESKARAWLGCIMRNIWVDECRRHQSALRTVPLDGIQEATADSTAYDAPSAYDVESAVLASMGVAAIISAMDRLPHRLRQVVILADLRDAPYGTIAEMLAIPVGTVASRLSRGRRRLQDILREQPGTVECLPWAS